MQEEKKGIGQQIGSLAVSFISVKTKLIIIITVIVILLIVIICALVMDENGLDEFETLSKITIHDDLIYYNENSIFPLPYIENKFVITSKFNPYRVHPVTGIVTSHKGLDLVGTKGCDILSIADGIVIFSGQASGYGNVVYIQHTERLDNKTTSSRYAHMSELSVKTGQEIKAGQVIGKQGNSGISTGEHLHLELRLNDIAVDIYPYLFGE